MSTLSLGSGLGSGFQQPFQQQQQQQQIGGLGSGLSSLQFPGSGSTVGNNIFSANQTGNFNNLSQAFTGSSNVSGDLSGLGAMGSGSAGSFDISGGTFPSAAGIGLNGDTGTSGGGDNKLMMILLMMLLSGDGGLFGSSAAASSSSSSNNDDNSDSTDSSSNNTDSSNNDCAPAPADCPAPAAAPAETPAPAAPAPAETTAASPAAQVWGDPHYVAFKGSGQYDVMGEAGKIYNQLSDSNVSQNIQVVAGKDNTTYVGTAGFVIGKGNGAHDIQVNADGSVNFDGQALQDGQKKSWDSGLDINGQRYNASVQKVGNKVVVNSGEYQWEFTPNTENGVQHLDQKVFTTNIGTESDGVSGHGLLGQTGRSDFDPNTRKAVAGGKQGEGVIEGNVNEYAVGNLFDTNFKYNKYNSQAGEAHLSAANTSASAT